MDELLDEIEARCDGLVVGYAPLNCEVIREFKYFYGGGSHDRSVALASILLNEVMNNWNGELKTLQRINEEVEGE